MSTACAEALDLLLLLCFVLTIALVATSLVAIWASFKLRSYGADSIPRDDDVLADELMRKYHEQNKQTR